MAGVVSVVQEGVLQKRGRVGWKHRYVKLVADLASHVTDHRLSAELLVYSDQKQGKLKKRMKIEEMINIYALDTFAVSILFNDGKILQFKAETNEAYLCWVSNLKAALGRGEMFHVQIFSSSAGVEHTLMRSMEVALPTHRLGQIDRLLVLTSPVHEVNLYAWDLNRVLTFIKSDIGIRMELCRTCAGSTRDTEITFIVSRPYLNRCMEFLCHEANITGSPTDEHGAWVYRTDHTCGFSNAPPIPAPPPPGDSKVTSVPAQCPASYVNLGAVEGPYSVSERLIVTDFGSVKVESKISGILVFGKPPSQAEKQGNKVMATKRDLVPPTSDLGDVEMEPDPFSSSLQLPPPSNQSSRHAPSKSPHIPVQPPPLPAKKKLIASRCTSNPNRGCASKQEVEPEPRPKALTVSKPETATSKADTPFGGTFEDEALASKLTTSTSKPLSGVRKCKPIPKPRSNIKQNASNQSMCSVSVSVTNTMETVNEEVCDDRIYI
eukprot:Em0014g689a